MCLIEGAAGAPRAKVRRPCCGSNTPPLPFLRIRATSLALARGAVRVPCVMQANAMSGTLAREQLLTAEQKGLLCRDDTIEGLVFHANQFLMPSS